jgi:hypothetical protein
MSKDILIRGLDDDLVAALDNAATLVGLSREEYLRGALADLVGHEGLAFRPGYGHGLRAFTPTGGMCLLKALGAESQQIQKGARDLTSAETAAYQRAALLAAPANGAKWAEARAVLAAAGFEVFAE